MNAAERQALESAGFRIGTVQDFLGLEDWEAQLIELKYRARKTGRRLREVGELTQHEVAKRIKSSQSRIAKIEAGSADVTLDLLARYLFAVGGSFEDLDEGVPAGSGEPVKARPQVKPVEKQKKVEVLVS